MATLWILARANNKVAEIRRLQSPTAYGDKWEEFDEADPTRAIFMRAIARATEVARAHDLAKAVHTLLQVLVRRGGFRDPLKYDGPVTEVVKRGVTLELLEYVASNYDTLWRRNCLSGLRVDRRTPRVKGARSESDAYQRRQA